MVSQSYKKNLKTSWRIFHSVRKLSARFTHINTCWISWVSSHHSISRILTNILHTWMLTCIAYKFLWFMKFMIMLVFYYVRNFIWIMWMRWLDDHRSFHARSLWTNPWDSCVMVYWFGLKVNPTFITMKDGLVVKMQPRPRNSDAWKTSLIKH